MPRVHSQAFPREDKVVWQKLGRASNTGIS
uniref:Uncharacterized protein n=1 Tax=Arundo donax TaxID=35708 RepID=A0A0A9FDB2_ARUDO